MMYDGPLGMSIDSAREIVQEHAVKPCGQCRGDRCWLLEWALKLVIHGDYEVRQDMICAVTLAARRIADVHKHGDDGLCSPCLRPDCEPRKTARHWLAVIKELPPADPTPDDIEDARLVRKAHHGYGCPDCTPAGCSTDEWAVQVVFDAIAKDSS
ncbi:hypothetical protein [Plantactinospora mayteni]|nr:hypothetical protein [Plantactinospora mayteni]